VRAAPFDTCTNRPKAPLAGTVPAKVVARATTVLFIARSTPSFPDAAAARGPLSLLNRALAHSLPNIPDGAPFADCVAATDGADDDADDGGGGGGERAREAAAAAAAAGGEAGHAGSEAETALEKKAVPDAEGERAQVSGGGAEESTESASATAETPTAGTAAKGAGRIVVASQPRGQACAVVGGIMATRLQRLGARGLCVDGRVRDLASMASLGLPVRSSPPLV
jgi:Aldolase/RraA